MRVATVCQSALIGGRVTALALMTGTLTLIETESRSGVGEEVGALVGRVASPLERDVQ